MQRHAVSLAETMDCPDIMFAVSTFLEDFIHNSDDTQRQKLIADEPQNGNGVAHDRHLCLLAAIAHRLSNIYRLPCPRWVNDPRYTMPHPLYAHDTENEEYRRYLEATTPPEFFIRNIFYGENVCERV